MQEMKNMINMRFGPSTWQEIVDLRAKRIQEERERATQIRREKLAKAKEFEENLKQFGIYATVVGVAIGLFIFLFAVVL
jgi:hypothetical protein